MADILLHGMEMPTEQRIEALIFKNGFVSYYDVEGRYIGQAKAVPLPEGHGRLIDADAFCRFVANNSRIDEIIAAGIISFVNAAPTIVPAEGGNADGNP